MKDLRNVLKFWLQLNLRKSGKNYVVQRLGSVVATTSGSLK